MHSRDVYQYYLGADGLVYDDHSRDINRVVWAQTSGTQLKDFARHLQSLSPSGEQGRLAMVSDRLRYLRGETESETD